MATTTEKKTAKERFLRPMGDRIIIRPDIQEGKTDGGIIIPEAALEKRKQGLVVAVGPGKWNAEHYRNDPVDFKPGDTVIFGKWSGTDVKLNGKELLICHQDDILAIVDEVDATPESEGDPKVSFS